jgi:hypothetical protein
VRPDPDKVRSVVEWPTPTNGKQLHSFLGMAGWLRRHTRFMSDMSAPLEALKLAKGSEFQWERRHQEAFDAIKQAVATAPLLSSANVPVYPEGIEPNGEHVVRNADRV